MVNEPQYPLFAEEPDLAGTDLRPLKPVRPGTARVLMPNRAQIELRASDLEAVVPEGHRARRVWAYVEQADLSRRYAGLRAVDGGSGRTPLAAEILFALGLYATGDGVGSARAIARLTQEHDAYRWICGGVQVNYHPLSDFRTDHGAPLDGLLTDSVAALLAAKAIKLKRVAQAGMRIRASAGAVTFRRRGTLEQHLEKARTDVATRKQQLDAEPAALSRRQPAARTRAAREREAKVRSALARLPELEPSKVKQGKKPEAARASTTEAEATVMKMSDGGFRPAYNAQLATDTEAQVIVGIDVVTVGSDRAQLNPMVEQVTERGSRCPEAWLGDGGFPAHDQLEAVADQTTVYAPVPEPKDSATDPYAPKPKDSEAVAQWRQRMGPAEATCLYKDRAATAECVNALARNRGLNQFRVRGSAKVRCVLLFHALAHQLLRTFALAPAVLGLRASTPATVVWTAYPGPRDRKPSFGSGHCRCRPF